jgi:flagellar hook-associated protein 1 FlgK
MADLFSVLHNGARALTAQRVVMATASHNIQNVSTDGFARQRVSLTTTPALNFAPAGAIGTGVRVDQITQARDRFVESRLPGLRAEAGFAGAREAALDAISAFDVEGGAGVAGRLGDMFAALSSLQTRPADLGVRRAALGAVADFSGAVRAAANDVDSARAGIDVELRGRAPRLQQLVDRLASLNGEIGVAAAAGGGPPNDLLDERQRVMDSLSDELGAKVIPGNGPGVTMVLPGGAPLVIGENAARIDVATGSDGRLLLSVSGTDGATSRLLDARDVGGAVGGLMSTRDVDLAAVGDALDTFAFEFAGAMNAAHAGGTALDGSSGRNLLAVSATPVGAARSLALDPSLVDAPASLQLSATGATGDAGNVAVMMALQGQPVAGATDPFAALAAITSSIGERTRSAAADRASATALLDHGLALRDSVSGVSVDEELVSLQQAERAFQAAAKVITTADQMLQTVLDLK